MTSGGLHSTVKTKQAKSGYMTSENNKSYGKKKYERTIDQMTRKVVLLAGQLRSLGGGDMWRKVRRNLCKLVGVKSVEGTMSSKPK